MVFFGDSTAQLYGVTRDGPTGVSLASRRAARVAEERMEAIVAAAADLDVDRVATLYAESLEECGVVTAWAEVLAPCLRVIGQRWERGLLGEETEHLASDLLVRELTSFRRRHRPERMGPIKVLLAGASGDLHHLPLQVVETELTSHGIRSIPLGANVPASASAAAITRCRPDHVFLWASLARPQADPTLEHLCAAEWTTHIVTGGPGWAHRGQKGRPLQWVDHASDLPQALHLLTVPGATPGVSEKVPWYLRWGQVTRPEAVTG